MFYNVAEGTLSPCNNGILQFVTFKPLSYCFEEIGFDVKASFASCPESRLIGWYSKPGDIMREF